MCTNFNVIYRLDSWCQEDFDKIIHLNATLTGCALSYLTLMLSSYFVPLFFLFLLNSQTILVLVFSKLFGVKTVNCGDIVFYNVCVFLYIIYKLHTWFIIHYFLLFLFISFFERQDEIPPLQLSALACFLFSVLLGTVT